MRRADEDDETGQEDVRWGVCCDPQAQDGDCLGQAPGAAHQEQQKVSRVVREKSRAPHRERHGTEAGAVGRFFVTPHAVHKYQREVKPNASYNQALSDLIKITNAGRQCGEYNGGKIREMCGIDTVIEMWRGPVVGTRSKQRRNSRMRFVVAYGGGEKPQVITVLPRGRGAADE